MPDPKAHQRHRYFVTSGVWEFPDGKTVSGLYCGDDKPEFRNRPEKESVPQKGPIPRGLWSIGPARTSRNVGPVTMSLEPLKDTNTFGRSAFRIHGDSRVHPGDASKGCIIAPRAIRERINASPVRLLEVLS